MKTKNPIAKQVTRIHAKVVPDKRKDMLTQETLEAALQEMKEMKAAGIKFIPCRLHEEDEHGEVNMAGRFDYIKLDS